MLLIAYDALRKPPTVMSVSSSCGNVSLASSAVHVPSVPEFEHEEGPDHSAVKWSNVLGEKVEEILDRIATKIPPLASPQ